MAAKELEKLCLARRLSCEGGQGLSGAFASDGNSLNDWIEGFTLAQQRRQRCGNDFANGVMIIVARKVDQPPVRLAEDRRVVECR